MIVFSLPRAWSATSLHIFFVVRTVARSLGWSVARSFVCAIAFVFFRNSSYRRAVTRFGRPWCQLVFAPLLFQSSSLILVSCRFSNPLTAATGATAGVSFDPAIRRSMADIPLGCVCERCSMYGHMRIDDTGKEKHQYWSGLLINICYYSGELFSTSLVSSTNSPSILVCEV